ncbi:response regulator [Nocardiopsis dassonvillei]|uniref:Two component transcriptional regulator, winged helix family n=1 Tax=Nocardiopsis dassonvillei (strain ATCC 23218 / DSM 43111 / CIP 107115 / JCM 7437 / KCTC 9190 / NBRC 14626 / NCTC 10488 / NRRL B-5397 / IMRU 509) TaxID=446468 RepID=D7B3Y3_NOCDD|nr:response regulator transcription factor [Nocardiopsis dassonvillei]ADH66944.1 two component transcriptional regulator, winged helix family [Nocardiopsis dassonvillei subsp. dassonvillei DSM 43111]APC35207.1 DNA-binding response regulator [Nocardiopsis dassonvillei]NKY80353.1 response regulator transcription factor [Nocardiopsis dassonvillei]VEI86730.1 KDP operon transcriptional regulatory protein KdpE [Nocardiopsis dassonvillei]
MRILVADDDPQILRALRVTLRARGYDIVVATNGADALNAAVDQRPDLYVIDLGMPHLDGVEVIEGLRGWTSAPILVVSGRTDSVDKVQALDAGADDYVTKPFAIDEFLARVRALTRRGACGDAEPLVRLGELTVDLSARTVTREGGSGAEGVRLTPTEWRILEILMRHAGKLVTRQRLLADVWGSEHVTDTGYLRLYVSQLRKKLEPDPKAPRFLITEPGMGYRFQPPG